MWHGLALASDHLLKKQVPPVSGQSWLWKIVSLEFLLQLCPVLSRPANQDTVPCFHRNHVGLPSVPSPPTLSHALRHLLARPAD